MNDLSFEIKTSVNFFKKLLEDYEEFCLNKTSSRIALNCAMTTWHLTEWVYNEFSNQFLSEFGNLIPFQKEIKQQCPSFQIMRDLANGTKHYVLTRHNPIVKETELHKGSFSNAFSRSFNISRLEIELKDGSRLYFEDEILKTIVFWRQYLQSKLDLRI